MKVTLRLYDHAMRNITLLHHESFIFVYTRSHGDTSMISAEFIAFSPTQSRKQTKCSYKSQQTSTIAEPFHFCRIVLRQSVAPTKHCQWHLLLLSMSGTAYARHLLSRQKIQRHSLSDVHIIIHRR